MHKHKPDKLPLASVLSQQRQSKLGRPLPSRTRVQSMCSTVTGLQPACARSTVLEANNKFPQGRPGMAPSQLPPTAAFRWPWVFRNDRSLLVRVHLPQDSITFLKWWLLVVSPSPQRSLLPQLTWAGLTALLQGWVIRPHNAHSLKQAPNRSAQGMAPLQSQGCSSLGANDRLADSKGIGLKSSVRKTFDTF